ncbi:phage tail protein [Cytobacillus oceanisediminis]|uniref:phage tail protein n=1 Tax=Cytobacillus oceanisediminis TaxID=665099 RepID=UPI00207968DF|nr:hypothetical protein [Cytobacillus oceanisediminis]MBY0157268.1 hypothetical protein [Cytobacillus firmus]USK46280.1 hypothetical protein LIT27_10670 [Cytobacillus oceanisediminis]
MQEDFAARITADINGFLSDMARVDETIRRTALGATAPITANITRFLASINDANRLLDRIPQIRETNLIADVTRYNRQMRQVQAEALALTRQPVSVPVDVAYNRRQFQQVGNHIRQIYRGTSAEAQRMSQEMRSAFYGQSASMRSLRDDQIAVQYGYFQMAQSSQDYTGSTREFMDSLQELGNRQRRINDQMIGNSLQMRTAFLQSIGTMLARSTQASKILSNYERMGNPFYSVNAGALRVADSLNRIANAGQPAAVALRLLGPTASMKQLNDMTMMITQGLMRMNAVALGAAVTSALLYSSLHKAAMNSVAGYEESFNRMTAAVRKAFQPMVDVFGAVMKRLYDFITAVANMAIKFNEAHPVLSKIIQGILMFIPALTLLLSPLAIGIGLVGGLMAAWGSLWTVLGPVITGHAAMMGTVLLVAAAIIGLTAGIIYLWNTNEGFRNAVISAWNSIKEAAIAVWGFLSPYINQAITAVTTFVKAKLDQMKQFWTENGTQIMLALSNAWNMIKGIFSAAMAVIVPILGVAWMIIKATIISTWNAIKSIINGALNVIHGIIKVFAGIFTGDFSKVWEGIKQIFKGALQILWGWINLYFIGKFLGPLKGFATSAKNLIKSVWNTIKGIFTNTLNVIKSNVANAFHAVRNSITSAMSSIRSSIQSAFSTVRSIIANAVQAIWSVIKTVFNTIVNTVRSSMNGVKTAIVNGWNAAKSFLSSINLTSIGKNIIKGLIKGIKSMVGAVGSAIADVAGNIKNKITGLLDIHSPSRWMRDMVGKNIVAGVIVGIKKMTGSAAKTTANMASAITGAFSPELAVSNMEISRTSLDAGFQMDEIKQQIKDELSVDLAVHHKGYQTGNGLNGSEKQPLVLQMVMPDGRVFAEWIVDDITEMQNFEENRIRKFKRGQ